MNLSAESSVALQRFIKFYLVLSLGLMSPSSATTREASSHWIVDKSCYPLCQGYFREPELPKPLAHNQISLTANRAYFVPNGTSHAIGHARLQMNNYFLQADELTLTRHPQSHILERITAQGRVTLQQPGLLLQSERAWIEPQSTRQSLENVTFHLYERQAWGHARHIIAYPDRKIALHDTEFTTCSPLEKGWRLKVKKLTLDRENGRGMAKRATLYYGKAPLFYSPIFNFPMDKRRQTGFLTPTPNFNNRSGMVLKFPFYWNIAPNYDLLFTPTLLSQRGIQFNSHLRYLTAHTQGFIKSSLLPHDNAFNHFVAEALKDNTLPNRDLRVRDLSVNHRYAIRAHHQTQLAPQWRFNLDFAQVSDNNYFVDFGNSIATANTIQLLQQADLVHNNKRYLLSARFQKHQILNPFYGTLTEPVYQQLPRILFSIQPIELPLNLSFQAPLEFTYFYKTHPQDDKRPTQGQRYHFTPALSLNIEHEAFYVRPRVQWDMAFYDLKLGFKEQRDNYPRYPQRMIPLFDAKTGLNFERTLSLFGRTFSQTLEPNLYYLQVPYRDQSKMPVFDSSFMIFDFNQLYRANRFAGADRINDARQLTLGVTSRLIDDALAGEQLNLSLGQIVYFKDRKVSLRDPNLPLNFPLHEDPFSGRHYSNFALRGRYTHPKDWRGEVSYEWDPFARRIEKLGLNINYNNENHQVFNLGYQFLRHDPNQLNAPVPVFAPLRQWYASTALNLDPQWRILARVHYDFVQKAPQQVLFGLEHQGCCTSFRVVGSGFLQPRDPHRIEPKRARYYKGIHLQFIFKGFTSVGHQDIDQTLARAIEGYRRH